jgi:hypothetical protein
MTTRACHRQGLHPFRLLPDQVHIHQDQEVDHHEAGLVLVLVLAPVRPTQAEVIRVIRARDQGRNQGRPIRPGVTLPIRKQEGVSDHQLPGVRVA